MNAYARKMPDHGESRYDQLAGYLLQNGGYWSANDIWDIRDEAFERSGIRLNCRYPKQIQFSEFHDERLKNEAKFYLLYSLKNRWLSAATIFQNYREPLVYLARFMNVHGSTGSFIELEISGGQMELFLRNSGVCTGGVSEDTYIYYRKFWNGLMRFITDYFDEREETEKDVWRAANIHGIRISAAEKSGKKLSVSFTEVPEYYRETVKRFLRRLITRRSWSYCAEMLVYIRYFFNVFYAHGYSNGFFEKLTREDIERYLLWIADDHKDNNATYRSKTVSFIRQFIDYIQLAEFTQAPVAGVDRLIYEDDYPKRERMADTLEKVRYIPTPVREQLDAAVGEIEPEEMIPVYILLRETGWRGTDVLNLRHGNCLDYLWNAREKRYISYLCGEITKTGIPMLRIPVRDEVAEMVKKLADEAVARSTEENNPDRYLFNTYEGRNMGMPMSKAAFVKAVQTLIEKKGIRDADGSLYHFKTHSLRHTRAMEYAEQGMPIGIIQQILGHCSLQMTLHYAKVSENALYEKWKETEELNLFHVECSPPHKAGVSVGSGEESVHYEYVRKSLDAVKVPFGTCFKPAKLACRQQMSQCLECSSFCSTEENIPEYKEEIHRVKKLIEISRKVGRTDWEKKNTEYLCILEKMLVRIRSEGIVHKNGSLREEK